MHAATHTLKKKYLLPQIFLKGAIQFSDLSKAFTDVTFTDSFSCKPTFTHVKLQPAIFDYYGSIIQIVLEFTTKLSKSLINIMKNNGPRIPSSSCYTMMSQIFYQHFLIFHNMHHQPLRMEPCIVDGVNIYVDHRRSFKADSDPDICNHWTFNQYICKH